VFSVLAALLTNRLPTLFKRLAGLLQSESLLSFPVTVVLLLWGFFVFLGVLWVFGVLARAYYEYTRHLGQIRYRSKSSQRIDVQQLILKHYYKAEKDTIDADIIVFGHTHVPEVSPADAYEHTRGSSTAVRGLNIRTDDLTRLFTSTEADRFFFNGMMAKGACERSTEVAAKAHICPKDTDGKVTRVTVRKKVDEVGSKRLT